MSTEETICPDCIEIPTKPDLSDYDRIMAHLIKKVKENKIKLLSGDCPIENLNEELAKEQKYTYKHLFRCSCGAKYKCGVCIRSSVPLLVKHSA